jgi:hypothetical protein
VPPDLVSKATPLTVPLRDSKLGRMSTSPRSGLKGHAVECSSDLFSPLNRSGRVEPREPAIPRFWETVTAERARVPLSGDPCCRKRSDLVCA